MKREKSGGFLVRFFGWAKENTLRSILVHIAVMIAFVVCLVLFFFYLYLPGVTRHGETITVPNLEGMHLNEMDQFLGTRNLRFEVADSGYSSDYPPLTVLKQFPKAGEYVKEKRKIYLTVKARVPQAVRMPDLLDGSLKNAELVLRSYGLIRGEITYVPDLAQNAILRQFYNGEEIQPGEFLPKGSVIDLEVGDGLGNRELDMPNFLGLDLEEARFLVEGSGLRLGLVMISVLTDEFQGEVNAEDAEEENLFYQPGSGRIVKQNPSPGDMVRLGELVDLWIGSTDIDDSLRLVNEINDPAFRRFIEENTQE
ncbi:MAG: PASTA domain-containing protein [Cyclobacteriaceae bacterium]|nr:PASTA domain-containing protein [Cyclobacteriaceae bacterium]